ncbi:MAG: M48 family metalloprotease [Comamonas sp.]|jgi:Zn-dependent protease with chaperone function|uniref:M48 family metalloprotease n=1 Tax=Comamonas sp. TaxID=34028 RepID=UPI0028284F72|nr:M48 family metalloprotease [Comamonas sp.]MDR0214680.1 M48 family metalloprotease [Comamonas sp.]
MRFWERQREARRSTRWLLMAFGLCVLAVVASVHLGLVLAWWLGTWIFGGWDYPTGFAAVNIGMTLLLVLGGCWIELDQLRHGGRKLAERVGAREARPGSSLAEQQLCNIVAEMCIAAHWPAPQVTVLVRTEAINAFAAGWDAQDAIIAVTQGALDQLSREEMQGLVAHELSHLREGDTQLNMQLAGMVFGLELIHNFGQSMRERENLLTQWFGAFIQAAGLVGWLCGQLLKAAVSRQREYLADARAVQWTRSKDGLGGVLRKVLTQRELAQQQYGSWQADERSHIGLDHRTVQHMLLAETPHASRLEDWLESHPSVQERIRRIYGCDMRPLPLPLNTVPQGR